MLHPRLPTHTTDAWDCGFVINPPRYVRGVSGRGGLVLAGGELIYMLRPGAETMVFREPPLDTGTVVVAAAEPRAPWRYAVASETLVALFFKNHKEDALVRLRPPDPNVTATHLAWARDGGDMVLFIRWSDGALVKTKPDMSGVDELDLPPMDAIASDASGVLALGSFMDGGCRVYLTRNGRDLEYHQLDAPLDPDGHLHLAVADRAIAAAVDRGGAHLSRDGGASFARCEQLATAGPLEFQGSTTDAALLGVCATAALTSIVRVDRDGSAARIVEFGSDGGPVPELTDISWDASRQRVWGASPQMGLVACTAPGAKARKKAPLC